MPFTLFAAIHIPIPVEQIKIALFSQIIEHSSNSLAVFDNTGAYIYANQKILDSWNVSSSDILGKNWQSILTDNTFTDIQIDTILHTVMVDKKPWQGEIHSVNAAKEDLWRHATIAPLLNSNNDIELITYVGVDISINKSSEKELFESEKRLRLALEYASDGIFDWNLTNGNIYFNDRYFTMLGYAPNEFEHCAGTWLELIHPEDKNNAAGKVQEYLDGKRERHHTSYRMRTKDGSWLLVLSRGGVLERGSNDEPLRLIGTHVNLNDLISE